MLAFYVVNAFVTDHPLSGNPAAVCVLNEPLSECTMQQVAAQHNLSETAFVVAKEQNIFDIRWFTPTCEVDLCGHATLAAAHVLREFFDVAGEITFNSASGKLSVNDSEAGLCLNFPARVMTPISEQAIAEQFRQAFQAPQAKVFHYADKAMVICDEESHVANFKPDFSAISALPAKIVYLSAPSTEVDFVCRVFAPNAGIPEDPVTGSAYTSLTPYWAATLAKNSLNARQISERGGAIALVLNDDRVNISGNACTVIKGEWLIEA